MHQKIREWEERVRETRATIKDVAALERILNRDIVLMDSSGTA